MRLPAPLIPPFRCRCDVVLTKDLVPVCRHEPLVSGTTDADKKFPDLKKDYMIDGEKFSGVHTVDLTLAQLKTLRAIQQNKLRSNKTDGQFLVPTLEEYIQVALDKKNKKVRDHQQRGWPWCLAVLRLAPVGGASASYIDSFLACPVHMKWAAVSCTETMPYALLCRRRLAFTRRPSTRCGTTPCPSSRPAARP